MKHSIRLFRTSVALTVLVLVALSPMANSQCQNQAGFAKKACEARTLASPAPGDSRQTAQNSGAPAELLTTGIADAVMSGSLDASLSPKALKPLSALSRNGDGSFILEPGMFEAVVESYALDTGSRAVTGFAGFLPAPIKGAKANLVAFLLKYSELHPEVGQGDIQQIFTSLASGTNYKDWPAPAQKAATVILPPDVLAPLQSSPAKQKGKSLKDTISAKVDQAAAMDSRLKGLKNTKDDVFGPASSAHPTPAPAVPSPLPAGPSPDAQVARGTWDEMPEGFYLRYLPEGTNKMRIQLFVPDTALKLAGAGTIAFDPTQYLAVLSQAPYPRTGITVRQQGMARR